MPSSKIFGGFRRKALADCFFVFFVFFVVIFSSADLRPRSSKMFGFVAVRVRGIGQGGACRRRIPRRAPARLHPFLGANLTANPSRKIFSDYWTFSLTIRFELGIITTDWLLFASVCFPLCFPTDYVFPILSLFVQPVNVPMESNARAVSRRTSGYRRAVFCS